MLSVVKTEVNSCGSEDGRLDTHQFKIHHYHSAVANGYVLSVIDVGLDCYLLTLRALNVKPQSFEVESCELQDMRGFYFTTQLTEDISLRPYELLIAVLSFAEYISDIIQAK